MLFNKIAKNAERVSLVSGDLIEGNPVFELSLNGTPCTLAVRSKVSLVNRSKYVSITVSLNQGTHSLFYGQLTSPVETEEFLTMLDTLERKANKYHHDQTKLIADMLDVF